jgi:hypothetical protein
MIALWFFYCNSGGEAVNTFICYKGVEQVSAVIFTMISIKGLTKLLIHV